MKKAFAIFATILVVSLVTACNLPKRASPGGPTSDTVATKVASTLMALTQAVQQTPSASPTVVASPTDTLSPTKTPTVTFTFVPTMTPTITLTPVPTKTPIPKPGTIAGAISGYPYGSVPALVVVASKQYSSTYWYVITSPGNTFYSMSDSSNKGYVSPGSYQVIAYDASGNSGGCTTIVTVISEQTVTCDITNWGGGYPAKPSDVPSP